MNSAQLLWGVLFGAIGVGLFVYGRRRREVVPLVCGVLLIVYPYFVANTIALVAIGVALTVAPFVIRL
jgi:hypothetical protein